MNTAVLADLPKFTVPTIHFEIVSSPTPTPTISLIKLPSGIIKLSTVAPLPSATVMSTPTASVTATGTITPTISMAITGTASAAETISAPPPSTTTVSATEMPVRPSASGSMMWEAGLIGAAIVIAAILIVRNQKKTDPHPNEHESPPTTTA